MTGFAGPGGTFAPINIVPGPNGRMPTLVQVTEVAPFASARKH
jgi:hypothetical protein